MQLENAASVKNQDLTLKSGVNTEVIPRSGSKYIIVFSLLLSFLLLGLVVFLSPFLHSPLQANPKPTLGLLDFETDSLHVQRASTCLSN